MNDNIFARIGDKIELWNDDNWHEFNVWKLNRLEIMYKRLDALSDKTEDIIDQLQKLKQIIDLVKKQIQPEHDSSIPHE